jgi:hypothetical protein
MGCVQDSSLQQVVVAQKPERSVSQGTVDRGLGLHFPESPNAIFGDGGPAKSKRLRRHKDVGNGVFLEYILRLVGSSHPSIALAVFIAFRSWTG